jgi:hypothetical protein
MKTSCEREESLLQHQVLIEVVIAARSPSNPGMVPAALTRSAI